MDTHLLQTFVTVAHEKHFGRAAEKLSLSQPAVSAHIHQLEHELGTVLFERWGRKTELTEPGQVLLRYAERVLGMLNEAAAAVRDLETTPQGELTVGGPASLVLALLPPVLRTFQSDFPRVKLTVQTAPSGDVVDGIQNGRFDLGLAYLTQAAPDMDYQVVQYDPSVLITPPDHPFAQRTDPLSAAELDGQDMIFLTPDTALRGLLDKELATLGVAPRLYMELNTSTAIGRMVAAGVGIAIASRIAVADELARGSVVEIAVTDLAITQRVVVLYRRDYYLSLAAKEFVRQLSATGA